MGSLISWRTTVTGPRRTTLFAVALRSSVRLGPMNGLRLRTGQTLTAKLGLVKAIISAGDRDSDEGRKRGIGVVLSRHEQETFIAENDTAKMTLKLERFRRRFDGGEPHYRYRFVKLAEELLPEDHPGPRSGIMTASRNSYNGIVRLIDDAPWQCRGFVVAFHPVIPIAPIVLPGSHQARQAS